MAADPLPSPEERAQLPPDGGEAFNALIHARSPYLLQHARNPVDWLPWGEEAFRRAEALTAGRPDLAAMTVPDAGAVAHRCRGTACRAPTADPAELLRQLDGAPDG